MSVLLPPRRDQLVLSMLRMRLLWQGSRRNNSRAIMSLSMLKAAKKRWIRRSDELVWAGLSMPVASCSKHTVCILHKAVISKTKNLMRALCQLSCALKYSNSALYLSSALVVFILERDVVFFSKEKTSEAFLTKYALS